jgi:hypothetical protein
LLVSLPAKAQAANLFTYGSGETELHRSTFDSADGWRLNKPNGSLLSNSTTISINNGVLKNTTTTWQRAFFNFSSLGVDSLDLDNGDIGVYLSFKTDKTKNENAKVYLELNATDTNTPDPYFEQNRLAFNIRPTLNINNPYELYLDPAFYIPTTDANYPKYCQDWSNAVGLPVSQCPYGDPTRQDQLKQKIKPPSALFKNASTYENFRLMLRKNSTNPNLIQVMPYYWLNNNWQPFETQSGSLLPLNIDLTQKACDPNNPSNCSNDNLLLGRDYFKSVSLLFRSNVPSVDAVAITQIPNTSSSQAAVPKSIPEPNSMLGLFAFGVLGAGSLLKCKK